MSNIRRQTARKLRDETGQVICSCGCGRVPQPPRKTWFSQECVQAWQLKNDPGEIRRAVWKRDHGICAKCACNCVEAFARVQRRAREIRRSLACSTEHVKAQLELEGLGGWTLWRSTGWDCEHSIPVVEGGGQCGLEFIETLCHPCHKKSTAALARRRAAAKAACDTVE